MLPRPKNVTIRAEHPTLVPEYFFVKKISLWEIRCKIYAILGSECFECGNNDERVFQIDHVHNDGWKHRNIPRRYYLEEIVLPSVRKEEGKFQLLCANCNWIKRGEQMSRRHYVTE